MSALVSRPGSCSHPATVVTVADLLDRNAPVPARITTEGPTPIVSVGSLLRREGRAPHKLDRPVQPRAHQQVEDAVPGTGRVRRSAKTAGTFLVVGSVFGAALLTDAVPTRGGSVGGEDAPLPGSEGSGGGALAGPRGAVIDPALLADAMGSGRAVSWAPVGFESTLLGLPGDVDAGNPFAASPLVAGAPIAASAPAEPAADGAGVGGTSRRSGAGSAPETSRPPVPQPRASAPVDAGVVPDAQVTLPAPRPPHQQVQPAASPLGSTVQPVLTPVGKVTAPVVKTVAPVVDTAAPVVGAVAAPVVDTAAPVVGAVAAPVADTAAPVVKAATPVVGAAAPVVKAVAAPVRKVAAPVVTAAAPVTGQVTSLAADAVPVAEPVTSIVAPRSQAPAPRTATSSDSALSTLDGTTAKPSGALTSVGSVAAGVLG